MGNRTWSTIGSPPSSVSDFFVEDSDDGSDIVQGSPPLISIGDNNTLPPLPSELNVPATPIPTNHIVPLPNSMSTGMILSPSNFLHPSQLPSLPSNIIQLSTTVEPQIRALQSNYFDGVDGQILSMVYIPTSKDHHENKPNEFQPVSTVISQPQSKPYNEHNFSSAAQ